VAAESFLLGLLLAAAVVLGGRHLYLRADRPGGFDCSLRVVQGHVPGLSRRFRAGYAGREVDGFVWRRVAWPSTPVRLPAGAIRIERQRAPRGGERLLAVPAHFVVMPVELADGTRLDIALARRRLPRVLAALGRGLDP